jgi:hypothetical protein
MPGWKGECYRTFLENVWGSFSSRSLVTWATQVAGGDEPPSVLSDNLPRSGSSPGLSSFLGPRTVRRHVEPWSSQAVTLPMTGTHVHVRSSRDASVATRVVRKKRTCTWVSNRAGPGRGRFSTPLCVKDHDLVSQTVASGQSFPLRWTPARFRFVIKRAERNAGGKNVSDIRCAAGIACPFAELRWAAPSRERPGRSGGGELADSLTSGMR